MLFLNKFSIVKFYLVIIALFLLLLFFQYKNNSNIYTYFIYKQQINKITLENENFELKSKLMELQKENEYLAKYKEIYNSIAKTTHIKAFLEIKYANNNQNGRYIIAKSNKDVKNNDLVVDKYGVLIGRVIESNSSIIKVQLINDNKSNLPVVANGIDGIIKGTDKKDCQIVFENFNQKVPQDGSLVLTSGFEGFIHFGVVVGRIKLKDNNVCIENDNIKHLDKLIVI